MMNQVILQPSVIEAIDLITQKATKAQALLLNIPDNTDTEGFWLFSDQLKTAYLNVINDQISEIRQGIRVLDYAMAQARGEK